MLGVAFLRGSNSSPTGKFSFGTRKSVLCREVVPFSEGQFYCVPSYVLRTSFEIWFVSLEDPAIDSGA